MADTIDTTRDRFDEHLARFRDDPIGAEPVIFGRNGTAEAVLLPLGALEQLLDLLDGTPPRG